MFYPGLVSISFRSLTPKEVISVCRGAQLDRVEWGTDSHTKTPLDAETVYEMGSAAGVLPCSCGSYYKLGFSPRESFPTLLKIAKNLHTDLIRIWGGNHGSADLTARDTAALAKEAHELATMADAEGITLALECHPNTLTDRYEAELAFLESVDHPRLATYWQPNQFESRSYNLEAAEALAPFTKMIHVYAWSATERFPLSSDREIWSEYLSVFQKAGGDYGTLLEFMPDDDPATLPREAAVLREIIQTVSK